MGVSLSKGGNVSLSKEAPGLTAIDIGLGWDVNTFSGGDFDLDAAADDNGWVETARGKRPHVQEKRNPFP